MIGDLLGAKTTSDMVKLTDRGRMSRRVSRSQTSVLPALVDKPPTPQTSTFYALKDVRPVRPLAPGKEEYRREKLKLDIGKQGRGLRQTQANTSLLESSCSAKEHQSWILGVSSAVVSLAALRVDSDASDALLLDVARSAKTA